MPTFVADEIVTAAKMNAIPKGVLGVSKATANQASITGSFVLLTNLSVTVTVAAGRAIEIVGLIQVSVDTVSDTTAQMVITRDAGATILTSIRNRPVGNGRAATMTGSIVDLSPTAGSITYDLRLRREVGTGTLTMNADAANVAMILVKDIGEAP